MPADGGGCGTRLKFKTGGGTTELSCQDVDVLRSRVMQQRREAETSPEKKEATLLQNQVIKPS